MLAAALAAAMFAALTCGRADDPTADAAGRSDGRGADSSRTRYRVVVVTNGGRVEGVVELFGVTPPDTVVTITTNGDGQPPASASDSTAAVCGGPTLLVSLVERQGNALGETVVWLADLRTGKALPTARRFDVANDQCRIEPRVQAALAGATLNVKSGDPILHRTRFRRVSSGETLETVEHTDAGSVVPVERVLRRPGLVEVQSELHPWMRGWIHVFDHPYFAVTSRDGRFALDTVPPGRWRLVAWHPRLGVRDTVVTVTEREVVRAGIRF